MAGPPTPQPLTLPAPAPESPRFFPNLRQALLVLLLFAVVTAGVALPLLTLQERVSRQLWLFLVVVLGQGLGVLAALRLARWPLGRVVAHLGFSTRTLRWLLVIAAGSLLLVGSLLSLVEFIAGPLESDYILDLFRVRSVLDFLLLFLTVVVAAPLVEELLVRGVLLRGLTSNWGVRGGVLWSAFFFAAIHMDPVRAAPAFINGVIWGVVLLRTGSLGTTFFLHSLNNGVVFALAQVALHSPQRAPGSAAAARDLPPEAAAALVAGIALAGVVGLWLVLKGTRALPASPVRLASLWGLAPAIEGERVAPGSSARGAEP